MVEKSVPLSEQELITYLETEDLPTTGNLDVLVRRCKNNNLPSTRIVKSGYVEHWEGKPNGLLNVCVERGLIHLQHVLCPRQYFSKHGKKINGETDENTSFVAILANCKDFGTEISILQKISQKYGATVWFTPKYHCEIAGEGIEYVWGFVKSIYRRIPLAMKKKKKDFENSVKNIFSGEKVKKEHVRRFSRRARQYICSYHVLHSTSMEDNNDESVSNMDIRNDKVSLKRLEYIVRQFKTHRCALDFDFKFIAAEVDTVKKESKTIQKRFAFELRKFIKVPHLKIFPGGHFTEKLCADDDRTNG